MAVTGSDWPVTGKKLDRHALAEKVGGNTVSRGGCGEGRIGAALGPNRRGAPTNWTVTADELARHISNGPSQELIGLSQQ
jgi:hypothetical protein